MKNKLIKHYIIKVENKSFMKDDVVVEELTPDDYGLILDALYEQAAESEYDLHSTPKHYKDGSSSCYWKPKHINSNYDKSLRKVAKKFEKIFGDKQC